MASTKGVSGAGKFNLGAAPGKNSIGKPFRSPSNPLPGHKRNESFTGNSKPSQASQVKYAGKPAATSAGFANTRARELGTFIGSVPVKGLQHQKTNPAKANKINK